MSILVRGGRWRLAALAALVVAISTVAEPRAGGNLPPSVPVLQSPADGDYVGTSTPVLAWAPSTDPQGDPITYEVEVTDGDGIVVGSRRAITGTVTAIDAQLTNFATYAWRARAADDLRHRRVARPRPRSARAGRAAPAGVGPAGQGLGGVAGLGAGITSSKSCSASSSSTF